MPAVNSSLQKLFQPRVRLPKPTQRGGATPWSGGEDRELDDRERYYERMILEEERLAQLRLFDELDRLEDVASVLDAHAEEATIADGHPEQVVQVRGRNDAVVKEVIRLFDRLEVETWATPCVRDMAKYGDDVAKLMLDQSKGVVGIDWRSPMVMLREEDSAQLRGFRELQTSGGNIGSLAILTGQIGALSNPWDYVHFRRWKVKMHRPQGADIHVPNWYGTSLLWRAGRSARRLEHMRDMLMLFRISKTLDRHIYKVDVGTSASPEEALLHLRRWKRALKRRVYRNESTGEYRVTYDPTNANEDIFWPTSSDSASTVDVLPGQPNVHSLADVDLMIAQLFATLRASPSYFGYDINAGSLQQNKSLGFQDIRWGRAVMFSQRAFRAGLKRIAQIHLALKGMDTSPQGFDVVMTPPSNLEQLQRLEATQTKVDVAERLLDLGERLQLTQELWAKHVMGSVLGMTDTEIREMKPGSAPPPVEETKLSSNVLELTERFLAGDERALEELMAAGALPDAAR